MNLAARILTMPLKQTWLEGTTTSGSHRIELIDSCAIPDPPKRSGEGISVMWSGGLGAQPFDPNPRTWLSEGWEALAHAREELGAATMLRPHAAHVVSDGLSCARLAREGHGMALSPASMLPPSLHPDLDDHLVRIFELAAPHASLLILEDLHRGRLEAASAGQGCMPGPLLARLIRRLLPPAVPIIVAADDLPSAMAWLDPP